MAEVVDIARESAAPGLIVYELLHTMGPLGELTRTGGISALEATLSVRGT